MAGAPIGPGSFGNVGVPTTGASPGSVNFGAAGGLGGPSGFQSFLSAIPRLLGKDPEEQVANATALADMFKGMSTQINGLKNSTLDKNIQKMHVEDSMAAMQQQFQGLQDPFLAAELLRTMGLSGVS